MRYHQLRNTGLGLFALACLGFTVFVCFLLVARPEWFRPPIGGAFALEDTDGRRMTDRDFRGRFMLVYFGYTHCPDVCPTKLIEVTHALEDFEKENPRAAGVVVPVFVTVDPARDTPEILREYVAGFHPRFVALTGTETAVAAMAAAYNVYYRRVPAEHGEDYLVDQTAYVFLLGPDGRYVTHFTAGEDATAMARNLAHSVK